MTGTRDSVRSILLCGGNLISVYTGWLFYNPRILEQVNRIGISGRTVGLIILFLLKLNLKTLAQLHISSLNEIFSNEEYLKKLREQIYQLSDGDKPTLKWFKNKTGVILECFYYSNDEIKVHSIDNDPGKSLIEALTDSVNFSIDPIFPIPYSYYDYDYIYCVIPGIPQQRAFFDLYIQRLLKEAPQSEFRGLVIPLTYDVGIEFGTYDTETLAKPQIQKHVLLQMPKIFMLFDSARGGFKPYVNKIFQISRAEKQPYYYLNAE